MGVQVDIRVLAQRPPGLGQLRVVAETRPSGDLKMMVMVSAVRI
jgi:hypothetical protein